MGSINRDIAQREQRESWHGPVSSSLSAAIEKWWVYIPARLDRYSSLLSNAWTDGIYLAAWPRVAMLLPLLALILGVVEGVGHFKLLSIWDVGMSYGPAYVFAQSLPLVIIAAFVGTLSANVGFMLVLGYVLGDFFLNGAPWLYRYNTFVPTFIHVRIPQLFTYVLFFALAVMPILSTNYLLAGLNRRISGKDRASSALRVGATSLVQALFLYEWTFIAPLSFHSLWFWGGSGSPVTVAFFHKVTSSWVIGAAIVAVVMRSWLTVRAQSDESSTARIRKLEGAVDEAADEGPGSIQRRPWLQALLAACLMTSLASGFMPSPLVALGITVLVVTILLGRVYLLPKLSSWIRWAQLITKIPEVLRILAAVLGTYWLTLWVAGPSMPNPIAGQFGVELVGLGLGLLLLIALLPEEAAGTVQGSRVNSGETIEGRAGWKVGSIGRIGLGIVFVVLLVARKVYAQCMDPWCCCNGDNHWCALAASGYIPFFGGVLPRKRRKKTKKDCSGLERAYKTAKSFLDTQDAKIQDVADKYNDDLKKLKDLDSQAKAIKDQAMSQLTEVAALEAGSLIVSAIADIVAGLLIEAGTAPPIDPIAKYIYAGGPAEGGIEVPPVSFAFDAVEKFKEFYNLWTSQAQGLNTDAYREAATKWLGYPGIGDAAALFTFCRLLDEMSNLVAKMDLLMDRYDQLLVERKPLAEKAAATKKAWEECLRENIQVTQ